MCTSEVWYLARDRTYVLDFISVHFLRLILQLEYAVSIMNPCGGVIMKDFRRHGASEGSRSQEVCLWKLYGVPVSSCLVNSLFLPEDLLHDSLPASLNTQEQWSQPGQLF